MARKIQYALGALIIVVAPLAWVSAQPTPRVTEYTVVITLPSDTKLLPGSHKVVLDLAGKKVNAHIKIASPEAVPASTSPASIPSANVSPTPSAQENEAPKGTIVTSPAPPLANVPGPSSVPQSPWLLVALAVLGTASLIGAGVWLYVKVYLPGKQRQPYREALELIRAQRYAEALPLLTQVESKLSDRLRRDARFFIAFAHFKLRNTQEAEHVLNGLHRESPKDPQAAYLLAYLRVEAGQYDAAEPVLTTMEKNGQLPLYHTKKLLGIVQFRRALAALKEGRVDGAAALFEHVEALGDFAAQIPPDLRNRHIALGTKALFDKDLPEARRQFTALEQVAAREPEAQRQAILATAKLGLGLAAWLDDSPEAYTPAEALLVDAAKLLDADGPLQLPWPQEAQEKDIATQLEELEGQAEQTAEHKQRERCLRDLHFLRGIAVLRAWRRLDGATAHAQLTERYEAALARFACARARDEQFGDVFLVVGLLMYYLHNLGPERSRGVALLEQAQKRGMHEPDAMEIINNRARIERANADAVDLYLQVLDKYLNDQTVRTEIRLSLLNHLNRYKKIQSWEKRPDLNHTRRVEPTVAEMRNRSEILLVRVEQVISSQGDAEEARKVRQLSETIMQEGERLYEQAMTIERNESELLALTGAQLLKEQ